MGSRSVNDAMACYRYACWLASSGRGNLEQQRKQRRAFARMRRGLERTRQVSADACVLLVEAGVPKLVFPHYVGFALAADRLVRRFCSRTLEMEMEQLVERFRLRNMDERVLRALARQVGFRPS